MDKTDEIIEKIKKAIRLARRTASEGERDTAIRLAKRLADSNGIAFEEISVGEDAGASAVMEDGEKVVSASGCEVGFVCFILREHFGVVAMFNMVGRNYARISWFGSRLNIEIAKHVWHILRRESLAAWGRVRKEAGDKGRKLLGLNFDPRVAEVLKRRFAVPKADKRSFMTGFFAAIDQKLRACPLRNDLAEAKEASEKKLREFKENNEVRLKRAPKVKQDYRSFSSGFAAGDKVNLARPCEGVVRQSFALEGN